MSERESPRPAPPISRRAAPKLTDARKRELAEAYLTQGAAYDALRPGYPDAALDLLDAAAPDSSRAAESPALSPSPAAAPDPSRAAGPALDPAKRAVDLGAGTGKLTTALLNRGWSVTAVDPSAAMLELISDPAPGPASPAHSDRPALTRVTAPAEATGLPDASADLVVAAQAWHWFDSAEATGEVLRILAAGGTLGLIWNTLDVTIPWVHRYSRIMHAGDILREGFRPEVGPGLTLTGQHVITWEDPRSTDEMIRLALTRSYTATAGEERRARVLSNLDWYIHDHLGHEPGSMVGIPYRTDLFLYRRA
ncbi:methyltransferase domain-containing protein [Helcobacillus massiliensis]|uniref:class I SAM-dependent methyltransferase n=1 Tax=Helcobacillus massiliensis TaxID=521392 RepID=UPI0021A85FF9|nr:methyltransferase domain-containing protein [Helcobacillus massiliensis]MCT1557660.1 methyltransferase domain-containing protein [Helcobacillus massiliensis]MCT2035932.1 methyltransferase domain-containing protein [Helcobacillus massiliensis]MCT2331798.1 methyltransferase domain-containing protein [Helcobacillus massiliensis]